MPPVTHKTKYDDSAEFQADLDKLKELSDDIVRLCNKPAFTNWLQSTDTNFSVDTFHHFRHVKRDASDLSQSVDGLYQEVLRAE